MLQKCLQVNRLTSKDIDNIYQTEYKIIDLKSDTKYIVYLLAVTVVDGEKTFVEDSTTVLGGLRCTVCLSIALLMYMYSADQIRVFLVDLWSWTSSDCCTVMTEMAKSAVEDAQFLIWVLSVLPVK